MARVKKRQLLRRLPRGNLIEPPTGRLYSIEVTRLLAWVEKALGKVKRVSYWQAYF